MNQPFYYRENIISDSFIDEILEEYSTSLEVSKINDGNVDTNFRNSKHKFISMDSNDSLKNTIIRNVAEINNEVFKFDINFFTQLQLTFYEKNNFYAKHLDIDFNALTTRKLTYVIQLQDEKKYVGGDLLLYTSDYPIQMPKKKGTLIVFPSFILHEVLPVLSGIRYSLVGWCMGNNYT